MKSQFIGTLLCAGISVSIATSFSAQSAIAGTLYNSWNYAIDPSYDSISTTPIDTSGVRGIVTGNGVNEIYGLALFDDPATNRIWVAINANLPLTGDPVGFAITVQYPDSVLQAGLTQNSRVTFNEIGGNNIGWGDLFFDFSGRGNFQNAQGDSNFFAIRFAPNNDSGVAPGVYTNVVGMNVAGRNPTNNSQISNAGFQNLYQHNQWLNVLDSQGRDAWVGDLAWNSPYFSPYTQPGSWNGTNLMPNVIQSGNRIGDVTTHTRDELVAQGLDLNFFFQQGTEIFGFSFEKPFGFIGDYFATLLQECLNDGISLLGRVAPPRPAPDPICPPPSLAQQNALLPVRVNGNTKYFENVPSNLWYDPPVSIDYLFQATGGTVFTQIVDFPCGIETDTGRDNFRVLVGDIDLGTFAPGDRLDFADPAVAALIGNLLVPGDNGVLGVKEFRIAEIDVEVCQNCDPWENQFAAQLRFNHENGSFTMTAGNAEAVPEPSTVLGLLLTGVGSLGLRQFRKR